MSHDSVPRFEQSDSLHLAYDLPPDLMVLDPEFVADIDQSSLTIGPGQKLFEKHRLEEGTLTSFVQAYVQQYVEMGQTVHVVRVNQHELEADIEALRDKDPDSADNLEAGLDVLLLFAMKLDASSTYSAQLKNYEMHQGVLVESMATRQVHSEDQEWI